MDEEVNSRMHECELDAEGSLLDTYTLTVTYTVRNRSDRNVYLFNRLYRMHTDRLEIDSNLFYLEMENSKLIICKKIAKPPEGGFVYKPIVPFVTKVQPGEEFTEEFAVDLPIHSNSISPPPSLPKIEQQLNLQPCFELGFFLASNAGDRLVKSITTPEGEAFYFEPFSYMQQKLLRDGPLNDHVPVIIGP